MKKRALALAVVALLAAIAFAMAGLGAHGALAQEITLKESPPGQILIVSANLQETNVRPDNDDPTDMVNLVRRLMDLLSYAPDALLVSEANGVTVANVAHLMTERTGYAYEPVVSPPDSSRLGNGIKRETAIVLNTDTMRAEGDGGYLRTELSDPNGWGITKDQAYLLAKERRGGLRAAMSSAHLNGPLTDKEKWSRQMATFLDEEYRSPSARQVEVIAGDFNTRRCVEQEEKGQEAVDCEERAFWPALTEEHGYSDAIFEVHGTSDRSLSEHFTFRNRIDYIFTRGAVLDADTDTGYDVNEQRKQCKPVYNRGQGAQAEGLCAHFYSDHRFLWALVGMSKGPDVRDDR